MISLLSGNERRVFFCYNTEHFLKPSFKSESKAEQGLKTLGSQARFISAWVLTKKEKLR